MGMRLFNNKTLQATYSALYHLALNGEMPTRGQVSDAYFVLFGEPLSTSTIDNGLWELRENMSCYDENDGRHQGPVQLILIWLWNGTSRTQIRNNIQQMWPELAQRYFYGCADTFDKIFMACEKLMGEVDANGIDNVIEWEPNVALVA